MPSGAPDFYQPVIVVVNSNLSAFDELAARLNSPYIGNRLGQVIFLDNFRDGIGNWAIAGTGVDFAAAKDITKAHSVGASAKVTTGIAAGSTITLQHTIGKFESEFYGLEVWFARPNTMDIVEITLSRNDGANGETARVRCDRGESAVQYMNSGASWTTIFTRNFASDGLDLWHRIKIVADFDNGLYKKIWFDDQLFEDSVPTFSSVTATSPRLVCGLKMFDTFGSNEDGWFDNVAMTINDVGE